MNMRPMLFGIAAMAAIVVASNILVQHLLGDWLTWGALSYPFAFLVTDLTNRMLGAKAARKVVISGFVVGVICSLIAGQFVNEYGDPLVSHRVALASGTAFLVAQLMDVTLFDRLRSGSWWRAPLVSSLAGSALDTTLFFSIAFSGLFLFLDPSDPNGWAREAAPLLGWGPMLPLWASLAVADFAVKLSLAMVALIPFRALSTRLA